MSSTAMAARHKWSSGVSPLRLCHGASRDPSSGPGRPQVPAETASSAPELSFSSSSEGSVTARRSMSSLQRLDDTGSRPSRAVQNCTRRRCSTFQTGQARGRSTSSSGRLPSPTRRRSTHLPGGWRARGVRRRHSSTSTTAPASRASVGPRSSPVTHSSSRGQPMSVSRNRSRSTPRPPFRRDGRSPSNASPHHRGSNRLGQASGRRSRHRRAARGDSPASIRSVPARWSESIRRRNGELTRSRLYDAIADEMTSNRLTTFSPAARAGRPAPCR